MREWELKCVWKELDIEMSKISGIKSYPLTMEQYRAEIDNLREEAEVREEKFMEIERRNKELELKCQQLEIMLKQNKAVVSSELTAKSPAQSKTDIL